VRRDGPTFNRLIAPDWVYTDERGTSTKREAIAGFTTGADTVTSAGNEQMRAHVYGTTAVVTGILWTKGRSRGAPFAHRYRYTDTWIRMNGQWRCVASQDYDMPK
jgi:ketosteroid isomerase-like protein